MAFTQTQCDHYSIFLKQEIDKVIAQDARIKSLTDQYTASGCAHLSHFFWQTASPEEIHCNDIKREISLAQSIRQEAEDARKSYQNDWITGGCLPESSGCKLEYWNPMSCINDIDLTYSCDIANPEFQQKCCKATFDVNYYSGLADAYEARRYRLLASLSEVADAIQEIETLKSSKKVQAGSNIQYPGINADLIYTIFKNNAIEAASGLATSSSATPDQVVFTLASGVTAEELQDKLTRRIMRFSVLDEILDINFPSPSSFGPTTPLPTDPSGTNDYCKNPPPSTINMGTYFTYTKADKEAIDFGIGKYNDLVKRVLASDGGEQVWRETQNSFFKINQYGRIVFRKEYITGKSGQTFWRRFNYTVDRCIDFVLSVYGTNDSLTEDQGVMGRLQSDFNKNRIEERNARHKFARAVEFKAQEVDNVINNYNAPYGPLRIKDKYGNDITKTNLEKTIQDALKTIIGSRIDSITYFTYQGCGTQSTITYVDTFPATSRNKVFGRPLPSGDFARMGMLKFAEGMHPAVRIDEGQVRALYSRGNSCCLADTAAVLSQGGRQNYEDWSENNGKFAYPITISCRVKVHIDEATRDEIRNHKKLGGILSTGVIENIINNLSDVNNCGTTLNYCIGDSLAS